MSENYVCLKQMCGLGVLYQHNLMNLQLKLQKHRPMFFLQLCHNCLNTFQRYSCHIIIFYCISLVTYITTDWCLLSWADTWPGENLKLFF